MIAMLYGQVVALLLTAGLRVLGDTWVPFSPCPNMFQYQMDSTGLTYGLINIPAQQPYTNLRLEVILGIDAVLTSENIGRIELVEDKAEIWRRLVAGSGQPIQYRVYFPLKWPLPVVQQITMNGNIYCSGSSEPTITKLALNYPLYAILPSGYPSQIGANKNNFENQWNNMQIYKPNDENFKVYYQQFTSPRPETRYQGLSPVKFQSETPPPHVMPQQPVVAYPYVPPVQPSQTADLIKPVHPATVYTNIVEYATPPPRTQPPTTTTTTTQAPGDECGVSIAGPLPLVINGLPTEKGEWPWLVAMFIKPKSASLQFQCGGSLLSKTIVLTAAHCVKYRGRPEIRAGAIVLFLGKFDLQEWAETTSQVRDVETVHIHPEYRLDDGRLDADLAILVLKEAVQYTLYVRPICLWTFSIDINRIVGQTGTAVGWGKDEKGTENSKPRKVSMPIVSHGDCILSNKELVNYVSNRTFCAGKKDGAGPCKGDSGGAFTIGYQDGNLMRWYLRGMVHLSLVDKNKENIDCDLHNYLIFTDVAMFMDWIREYVT